MSKLAERTSALAAASEATRLSKIVAGGRGELVELPLLGKVWIELAGERRVTEIEGEVWSTMAAAKLELSVLTAATAEGIRAAFTLAACVREADDHAKAFGTVEEWRSLDLDVLNAAWQAYSDVRERLDPCDRKLTDAERAVLEDAISKKNAMLLRPFGVVTLATYLASMGDRPPSSPEPRSSSGEPSPAP